MARVVIHHGEDPNEPPEVYVDGDVEVIVVCDYAPKDRFYRMRGDAVPNNLALEIAAANIGHEGDGSEAEAVAHKAIHGKGH
jgi:hypothetical protein